MPADKHPLASAVAQEQRLPTWLTHLWQRRFDHDRLGLVLGAGVSYDAHIPMWEELVKRLAIAADVPETRMAYHRKSRFPETFLAEILFRKLTADTASSIKHLKPKYRTYHVNSTWKQKIRDCLYYDLGDKSFEEATKNHIYLKDLAKLICKARFAVTFNFDDIIDQAVIACVEEELKQNPFSKISNPDIIYYPKVETRKHAPVIYHINGSITRDEIRRSSEYVILTEDAFADVMLSPNSYDAQFVINQFAMRTFLLLGISLSDNSLKNILRSSAKRNPANFHFIIFHQDPARPHTPEERADIFDVNFNVYNLVSIFLTTAEIKSFIEIISSATGDEFDTALKELVSSKIDRKYYIIGSVAAGKTSALDGLRCFSTFEEFGGRVPAVMYQDDRTITAEDQKIVDDYLFPQLIAKNRKMIRLNSGVRITDRAYLDLFAFSKRDKVEIRRKAVELKKRVNDWGEPLERGHIFFLKADKEVLKERLARRGTRKAGSGKVRFDATTLIQQQEDLLKTYKLTKHSVIDTSETTAGETAKAIAKTILLGKYEPFDFATRLEEIIKQDGEL